MENWWETPMIAFFVDGAAMRRQATLKRTSWEPYAHAMDKVCFEEGFHVKHGEDIMRELSMGSKKEQETHAGGLRGVVAAHHPVLRADQRQKHASRLLRRTSD